MIDLFQAEPAAQPSLLLSGLVAGIGLRTGADFEQLLVLIDSSLAQAQSDRSQLVALTTIHGKADHPALRAASRLLGIPILSLAEEDLAQDVPNPSRHVAAALGLVSVAEAAALAFGPLVLEKQRGAGVTCALSRYGVVSSSSRAASAASTLATSSAGP